MTVNLSNLKRALVAKQGLRVPTRDVALYSKSLRRISAHVYAVFEETVGRVLVAYDKRGALVQDSLSHDLESAWTQYSRRVSRLTRDKLAENTVRKTLVGIDVFHRRRFVANIKKELGVDIRSIMRDERVNKAIQQALTDNLNLIKSFEDSLRDRATRVIAEGLTRGRDYQSIRGSLLGVKGVESRRAKLIARDQTQKFFANIDEARQRDIGVEEYKWRTAGDQRVRKAHRDNDGKVFRWDKPPKTGHPGHDVQCRCYAQPVLSAVFQQLKEMK